MGRNRQSLPEIELVSEATTGERAPRDPNGRPGRIAAAGVLSVVVVAALLTSWWLADGDRAQPHPPAEARDLDVRAPDKRARRDTRPPDLSLPAPLVAVERYRLAPGGATARGVLDSIGGLDAMVVANASGAADAVAFDPADPDRLVASTGGSHASVLVGDTRFALPGAGLDLPANGRYEWFVAQRGDRTVILTVGDTWSWVDSPLAGVVIAYPVNREGATAVWDATSLERVDEHPFAGRPYQRLAVSPNLQAAVAITTTGALASVDPRTGAVTKTFGSVNPTVTGQAITLDQTGNVAITVDRDGTVSIWWVGDDRPLAVLRPGPAPTAAPAVHPAARRIAVRHRASWQIIDTELESWVERACELAGRRLTRDERNHLDLASPSHGCG